MLVLQLCVLETCYLVADQIAKWDRLVYCIYVQAEFHWNAITVEPLYNGHPWDPKFCPL